MSYQHTLLTHRLTHTINTIYQSTPLRYTLSPILSLTHISHNRLSLTHPFSKSFARLHVLDSGGNTDLGELQMAANDCLEAIRLAEAQGDAGMAWSFLNPTAKALCGLARDDEAMAMRVKHVATAGDRRTNNTHYLSAYNTLLTSQHTFARHLPNNPSLMIPPSNPPSHNTFS